MMHHVLGFLCSVTMACLNHVLLKTKVCDRDPEHLFKFPWLLLADLEMTLEDNLRKQSSLF